MVKFHKNRVYHDDWTAGKAGSEIKAGLDLLKRINSRIVVFQGSARIRPGNKYYEHAKKLAFELGRKKYAIMTGGGPGIMHAANVGAMKAKTTSIGCKSELLENEKIIDKLYTDTLHFHFFFARRFIMLIKTEAIVYYPGGFGTLNELLENAMLMQNDIVDRIPLICVGKYYWKGLFSWLKANALKNNYMDKIDFNLIRVIDDVPEIIKLIDAA